jgi:hypothetical protein
MTGVTVSFGANIQPLVDGIAEAKAAINSLTSVVEGPIGALSKLAEAFAAGFAVDKIAGFVNTFAELGHSVEEASRALGMSTQQIQTLNVAEALAGEQSGNLTRLFTTLSRNLESAASPTSRQAQALHALGLSSQALLSLPMDQAFERVSAALEQYGGGINKSAIASALFGRNLQEVLPLVQQAAQHFQEASEVGERTGAIFSDELIAKFNSVYSLTAELGLAFKGLGGALFDVFGSAIAGLLKFLDDFVEELTASVKEGGALYPVLEALAIAFQAIDVALAVAMAAVETFWEVTKTAVFAIAEAFKDVGRIMYDVFTFNWSDVSGAWDEFSAQMQARAQVMAGNMQKIMDHMVGEIKASIGNAFQMPETDNRPQAPSFGGATDAIKAQAEEYQALVKAAQEAYATTNKLAEDAYSQAKEHLTSQAKDGQITYQQETAALLAELNKRLAAQTDALNKEYAAEASALAAKVALYPQGTAQWRAAIDQQTAAYQKYTDDLKKLDAQWQKEHQQIVDQAMQHSVQQWQSALGTIESSFNSQLRGLLAGTTSWSQAWRKMLGDMIIKWIEMCEQMVVKWLATQLAQTTAAQTGAAARAAADESASAAGLLSMAANAVKAIMTDAGQAFAGVFAFLAPTMGPAAAGPAAAAQASVSAAAIFAEGTDYVLRGGLALIHPGETIIPAARGSGPFTGGGNMSPQVHAPVSINVSALDSQSVARFFNDNSRHMLRAINDAVKRGAHLGLSRSRR